MSQPQIFASQGHGTTDLTQSEVRFSADQRGCSVLRILRSEHSEVLAGLLALGPNVRRVLVALTRDPSLQCGLLAIEDSWNQPTGSKQVPGPTSLDMHNADRWQG